MLIGQAWILCLSHCGMPSSTAVSHLSRCSPLGLSVDRRSDPMAVDESSMDMRFDPAVD